MKKQEKLTRSRWPIVEGIAFLASQIGAPESLIKQAKRNGSRAFLPGNRIDTEILVPELLAMLTKSSEVRDFRYESTRRQRAEADKIERENRIASGEVIPIEQAAALFGAKLGAIAQQIDALPALIPGLSLAQRSVLVTKTESIKAAARAAMINNQKAVK